MRGANLLRLGVDQQEEVSFTLKDQPYYQIKILMTFEVYRLQSGNLREYKNPQHRIWYASFYKPDSHAGFL